METGAKEPLPPQAPPKDGPEALVGQVLGGRYRVLSLHQAGRMGPVYNAQNDVLERAVAIRVLAAESLRIPDARDRFHLDARVANRVRHPAVVDVLDLGETEDGRPYVVMEYLAGQTLRERLARGPMPLPELLETVRAVCEALGAAHDVGIVHPDLTPSNIFLLSRPTAASGSRVKILDFGVSLVKAAGWCGGAEGPRSAPPHVAPEIALGYAATPASNVYAVGAVLYEALAGRPPSGATSGKGGSRHAEAPSHAPEPLRKVVPGVSPRLSALVASCLRTAPLDRPASLQLVADEIDLELREAAIAGAQAAKEAGPAGADGAEGPPVQPAGALRGVAAWRDYLDRARAIARKKGLTEDGGALGDLGLRLAEVEAAIAAVEGAEAELAGKGAVIELLEGKEGSGRERFARAHENLRAEEMRLEEHEAALEKALKEARDRWLDSYRAFAAARLRISKLEVDEVTSKSRVPGSEHSAKGVRVPRRGKKGKAAPAKVIVADDAPPGEPLVRAYREAGEAAAKYTDEYAKQCEAERSLGRCEEELRDVRFQLEQLTRNADEFLEDVHAETARVREEIEALESQRDAIYRKLIDLTAALQA